MHQTSIPRICIVFIPSASAAEPRASFRPTTVSSFMPAATPARYNHFVFLAQVGPAPTRQLRAVVSLTVTISVIFDERNSVLADSSCLSPHACFLGHWSFVPFALSSSLCGTHYKASWFRCLCVGRLCKHISRDLAYR
ncbi:hypothetical protein BD769DRAFT_1000754 [Suillus cothurnatus]|nr:hypothetical protein BD769DRAFT_1000754 [Suillus cothurnatus]